MAIWQLIGTFHGNIAVNGVGDVELAMAVALAMGKTKPRRELPGLVYGVLGGAMAFAWWGISTASG
jgi:hypothetical protein